MVLRFIMEWSKDKTMKLIELLQANGSLWNASLSDSRQDKQKRREEVRHIAEYLEISIADTTKKIQHLRTQYNREQVREARSNALTEDPDECYISNWYAYEYLHFLRNPSKPYRIVHSDAISGDPLKTQSDQCNSKVTNHSPPFKISKTNSTSLTFKEEIPEIKELRDDFSVFGEYIANELRSLKGEKNQLIAKKKILDVIFDVKMSNCEQQELCTVFSNNPRITNNMHNDKFTTPLATVQIDSLPSAHRPSSGIREILIEGECSYSNFKVDTQ